MTAVDLLQAAARHWWLVLIGLALTVVGVFLSKPETVYWANLSVTVVAPPGALVPKTLEDSGSDAVPAATMLMRLVNGGHSDPKSTSPDATLYGEGKRSAVSARLRDTGGQWVSQIPNPIIDVQAVDSSAASVAAKLIEERALINRQLLKLQDDLSVVPSQRLILSTPPIPISIQEVSGSRVRTMLSTLLLGMALTVAAVYWFEAARSRIVDRTFSHRPILNRSSS